MKNHGHLEQQQQMFLQAKYRHLNSLHARTRTHTHTMFSLAFAVTFRTNYNVLACTNQMTAEQPLHVVNVQLQYLLTAILINRQQHGVCPLFC